MIKSIVISEYGKYQFNTGDFIYQFSSLSEYLEVLQWLKDNNIWYHSVYREDSAATYEILYMDEEDIMAFKLRWT